MKNAFILKCTLIIGISIIASSCMKNIAEQPIGCEPAPRLVLPFNVLDAKKGEDLFFSASPRYAINSIYFFSTKDKIRKDTIRPVIAGTGVNRLFTVQVTNAVTQDTLLMRVATDPYDVIVYSIKDGTGECPYLRLDQVSLNGTRLTPNGGRFSFLK